MTLLTLAPSPSWAQKSDALEEEARGAQERLRAIRFWERQLREAEEARLKGECAKVASYHLSFQKNLVEEPWSTEIVANLRRRMEEIALRDCPPGSGRPSITLSPPSPQTGALDGHDDILDELAGDPDPTAPDASAPKAPQTDPTDPSFLRGRMSVALTTCDRKRFEELKRQLLASLDRRIGEATDEFTRGRLMRERELAEAAVMPEPCPPVEPPPAPRTVPPPPPRQPEEVHVPPRPLAEPPAPVGSVGSPVPDQRRTVPPPPPRQPEEVHVPPRPLSSSPAVDRSTLIGARLDFRNAHGRCDAAGFEAEKKRLLGLLDALITQEFVEWRKQSLIREREEVRALPTPEPCVDPDTIKERAGDPLPPALNPVSSAILNLHNEERAEVGAQPLQWDPRLAANATAYARHLASGGPYAHASRAGRETTERENLGMGRIGDAPVQIMQSWLNEKPNFSAGIFPNVSKTGDWYNVGHYSQMIWGPTTHVGCGSATGAQWEYFVCRYSPPGNQDGQPVGLPSMPQPRTMVAQAMPQLRGEVAGGADIAPPNSSTTVRLPPPPPPPPTARDDAPEGKEENHPLNSYFNEASARHATAVDCGDRTAQEAEMAKMRYALDELKKRLKAARKAGPYSAVKPADVQKQIDEMEGKLREAEQRKPRGECPTVPPAPQQRGVVAQ